MNLLEDKRFNHQPNVHAGFMATECGELLTRFFREIRARNSQREKNDNGDMA
jgi:tRNA(adenine34) deaminase